MTAPCTSMLIKQLLLAAQHLRLERLGISTLCVMEPVGGLLPLKKGNGEDIHSQLYSEMIHVVIVKSMIHFHLTPGASADRLCASITSIVTRTDVAMAVIALISDVHANLEALNAVLADIDTNEQVEHILCLGDIAGYGPDPEPVLDVIRERAEICLMGNHDHALLNLPIGFNKLAEGAINCQKAMMDPAHNPQPEKKERWEWLQARPAEEWIGQDLYVHASPKDKIFEYLVAEDTVNNPGKLAVAFSLIRRRCYIGHTHRPGIITDDARWFSEKDVGFEYEWPAEQKLIINVSSVGQPRDRDPRACYAIIDDAGIRWHRIDYDIDETVRKVKAIPALDPLCGERLRLGR